ncbi:MAG: leucine--tRNA ligase [Acholeplasmatales bacterium]|jgi:leucyl-tRNA synthetase|nr:leucine--tRNA ligase [Acholeplasmataceae bacterium]MCK9289297.1 leucine--tRNA ligase [Acholeplasmataceae bacterium]MCK9427201.1 leucine--tRNA ligase [Acholeplasmataceae bacterium]MDY0115116.1 leucine--tRNA ligase [Acholeplasmatales bacterium]HHT39875.1 leucine--tRNA ligase [Acholeplasmataceae bacterium]
MQYDFKKIEKKWQNYWLDNKTFKTENSDLKPKYYVLNMFPYPSADGLHVGHIESYTATDIVSRFKRMQGYNVLHPQGWDAFGLPAEQYALQTGNDPKTFINKNILNFKRQIIASGMGIDWEREINTSDSNYFKWTQWIFIKLFEHGLAERKKVEVNFCEGLGTVLANDEILIKDGQMVSERGHYPVVKKEMLQWVLKITKYADRLLEDLKLIDWPENIKEMQKNWIGRSEGTNVVFKVVDSELEFAVFTTRIDTIYGATYLVLAPEHPLVLEITSDDELKAVQQYIKVTKQKSELDRLDLNKDKTGVFTGAFANHPLTGEKLPIWIADYVLYSYGTGAVMAVPSHDERDFEFALKHGLDFKKIIDTEEECYTGDGNHINSPLINDLNIEAATIFLNKYLEERQLGKREVSYRLRDWIFSRQRYWGEPFPVLINEDEIVTLPLEELPLELPVMHNIKPSGTGESPLANAKEWLYVRKGDKVYQRDTNTMPQLAGSSWYYLAYILKSFDKLTPLNSKTAQENLKKWLPVNLYIGGAEHAVGHLLYARFWHKFLYDLEIVSTKEPFLKLVNQGMILGSDNVKMSKSRGNVVNPDDVIKEYGADTLRLYEMFMGPLTQDKPWQTEMIEGSKRFLERVWRMYYMPILEEDNLDYSYHYTVKKVTEDYENLSFNTAISQMMIFVNDVYKEKKISKLHAIGFLKLLNPICPHITEELYQTVFNKKGTIAYEEWPIYDEDKLKKEELTIVVQVNGKLRDKMVISTTLSEEEIKAQALQLNNVKPYLQDKELKRIIVVKNKLVNIVV